MRILLATDGSDDAKAAAHWLERLPLPADREVMVITVVDAPALPEIPDLPGGFRSALVAEARRLADDTAAGLERSFATATGRVVEGHPRDEIVAVATTWGADLIVMGARGLGAIKEFFLGSVSLGVARQAPCPVLVCKGTPRDLRAITVALDGSEHARQALAWVLELPLPAGVRMQLVSAVERQHYPSSAPGILRDPLRQAVVTIEAERRAAADNVCAVAAGSVGKRDVVVATNVQTGRPGDVIVHETHEHGSDLVVVGARGLRGLDRLVLGSVSEFVLRHARCPVLIVRPRPTR